MQKMRNKKLGKIKKLKKNEILKKIYKNRKSW